MSNIDLKKQLITAESFDEIVTASEMIDRLQKGFERYEKVRRLHVPAFAALFAESLKGEKCFDQLVDEL